MATCMTRLRRPSAGADSKVGVLLINLGTPDAPEARAVRRYLAEFLSDPRVIEIPAIAWKPILHGIILRTRPRKSAQAYNQVWTNEGSPLRVIAHRQTQALRARLTEVSVHYAMRYGNPGHRSGIANMVAKAARASSRLPSIRNIAQRRRRRRTMPCSRRWRDALAARVAHASALSRRSALHRSAAREPDAADDLRGQRRSQHTRSASAPAIPARSPCSSPPIVG